MTKLAPPVSLLSRVILKVVSVAVMNTLSGPEQTESRRWKRYAVEIPATVNYSHAGNFVSCEAKADSVSRGGMRLFVPRTLEPGMAVTVEVSFPYHSTSLKLRGVVRNANGFNYGVELWGTNPYQQWVIERVCRAYELLT